MAYFFKGAFTAFIFILGLSLNIVPVILAYNFGVAWFMLLFIMIPVFFGIIFALANRG